MTTPASDDEYETIRFRCWSESLSGGECWGHEAVRRYERLLFDAGLAAGRAELQPKLEKAEANYRFMVEHAADQKLDGYRELAQRARDNETRAVAAEQKLAALVEGLRALRDGLVEDGHWASAEYAAEELDRLIQSAAPTPPTTDKP